MTLTPHPLPPKPPAQHARILVMVSRSNVHAEVYARGRWDGIAKAYSVPAKSLGYTDCIVRFPATKLGNARPDDTMSRHEIWQFLVASTLGVPFIPYMHPPAGTLPIEWLREYSPGFLLTFYDQSVGLCNRDAAKWNAIVAYHGTHNVGVEPLPDINIPEQHAHPSIIWWSLLQQNNPNWLPVAKRRAEMLVVLDLPEPTREKIVAEGRRLWALGYSPVVLADHAVDWGINVKEFHQ